jgi:hypothetical protein
VRLAPSISNCLPHRFDKTSSDAYRFPVVQLGDKPLQPRRVRYTISVKRRYEFVACMTKRRVARRSEATIALVSNDTYVPLACDLDCSISRAIVDDEYLVNWEGL